MDCLILVIDLICGYYYTLKIWQAQSDERIEFAVSKAVTILYPVTFFLLVCFLAFLLVSSSPFTKDQLFNSVFFFTSFLFILNFILFFYFDWRTS